MAYYSRKTKHAGAKKGNGAFWGPKQVAKHGSNRKRRRDARPEIKESATGLEQALAEAAADVKAGRVSQPYHSAREFVDDDHARREARRAPLLVRARPGSGLRGVRRGVDRRDDAARDRSPDPRGQTCSHSRDFDP